MAKTVLICDDNEIDMRLFVGLLEAEGYRAIQATSGRDAVDFARAHRPGLIALDISLPMVAGEGVVRTLKSDPELKAIPIVAVTAHAMKGDAERFMALGCDGYISKPIAIQSYLEVIAKFLSPPMPAMV